PSSEIDGSTGSTQPVELSIGERCVDTVVDTIDAHAPRLRPRPRQMSVLVSHSYTTYRCFAEPAIRCRRSAALRLALRRALGQREHADDHAGGTSSRSRGKGAVLSTLVGVLSETPERPTPKRPQSADLAPAVGHDAVPGGEGDEAVPGGEAAGGPGDDEE